MDFARKQLEKYGWSEGKGLGKYENGISVPLKPKLKRSVTGVGHDAAADFTEHWWTQLYNKAAGNVEVEDKKGKTKKIKTKDDKFKITRNTWQLNRKTDGEEDKDGYSNFFVKKAILTSGGSKTERVDETEESEDEKEKKDVFQMTDEELFAACEGRTAHKGARHGLRATGKLARIERQESLLLTENRFKGYSHAEKLASNEHSDDSIKETKEKNKRKFKHGTDCDDNVTDNLKETIDSNLDEVEVEAVKKKKKKKTSRKNEGEEGSKEGEDNYSKETLLDDADDKVEIDIIGNDIEKPKKKKKNKQKNSENGDHTDCQNDTMENEYDNSNESSEIVKQSKKSKRNDGDDEPVSFRKKKKKDEEPVIDDSVNVKKVKKNKVKNNAL